AAESSFEGPCDAHNLFRRFVREFQAELRNARVAPGGKVGAGFLRFGSEYGIAAPDVSEDRMSAARGVLQCEHVFFAGPAAIAVTGAGGQKAAEDAVLGMENGQVLIGDGLDTTAADLAGEIGDLFRVEVVRGSEAAHAKIQVFAGGES